jgi:hypothetical protein
MTLASRALPTLEGAWSELAQQVLAPLRRVPADLYLVYNVVSVGEGLVVDGGAGGDGVVAPWFNSVIGQRFENMWHPSRDPRHIGKDEINRFAAGFDVWTIPEEERLKLGSYRMYHAVGLRWTRRMLAGC